MSYVINPQTNRHIKVGGASYRKLMRQQLAANQQEAFDNGEQDIYVEKEEPYQDLQYVQPRKLRTSSKQQQPFAPRKRMVGKSKPLPFLGDSPHAGKKVRKRRTQPTQEEISQYTAKSASAAFQNNMGDLVDKYTECETEDDLDTLEKHLQKLILNEMMKGQKQPPKQRLHNLKQSVSTSKKIMQPEQDEYELVDSEEYDD